ncbi:DMT family transporter [Maribacter polysiphoniae]|uniref:DMT family transporter n=1 Tax=Maribacter polysiphoniae TaxID=429344 RepID=A0A316DU61_9FLAO|nr:DMT family transporter [Maribacter polysiphoniae]MBD1262503.1 DMT family transporter [Maribacter polysiphoniae]PWK21336.1 threonine/homoserine efflux transporter RhtA [Maribacter polysiphoniae]
MVQKTAAANSGIVFAIIGVVLFSAKAVLVKVAYTYEVDHLTLLLFRMVFALPFYLLIAFSKKPLHSKEINYKDYLWVVFFGFIGYYLASLFDFMGLQYIKAGLERIILFIYPTMVVVLSWLIFRKSISKIQIIAIIITYLGVILTFWNEEPMKDGSVILGGILIFFSALTYASYLVGSGWLIPKFGVMQFTSYAMIVSTVCIVLHYSMVKGLQLSTYPKEVYYLGIAMAIFSTLIPSFLVSAAIKRLGAPTFSLFGSLGPVSTIILAFFFLDERITVLQIIGMLIVIGGVTLVSRQKA